MQFARVPDQNTMKATLAAGIPVSCGVDMPAKWLHVDGAISGKIEEPAYGGWPDGTIAGHTMLVVGYDDRKGAWLFRNSWGTGWGLQGHAWIDYSIIEKCCHPRFRWAIGQINILPQLAITGHATLTQMAAEVRKSAHEDMAAWLASRKKEIGSALGAKLETEAAGFRARLRASSPDRSGLIGRSADGPGAGGGYDRHKGPGAGGGYGPSDGPGAGGGYRPNDGPGAGGGYDD
ncbi:MAG: C1 family peptidase, partial [Hyphomonadaceae bacterium]|nr:C1 family peptidase [Hyphomonadaceae bacterium]